MEHKLAAYRFLIIRMHSLPLKNENKHKVWNAILLIAKTNGIPYSIISELNMQLTKEISLTPSRNNTLSNHEKWVTFTYYNPMVRKITNFSSVLISKLHSIQITQSTIYSILSQITPIHIYAQ
jgi:hypothetical protein